jgi:hypothetical protein
MVCKETTGLKEKEENELTTMAGEDIRAGHSGEASIRARPGKKSNSYGSPEMHPIRRHKDCFILYFYIKKLKLKCINSSYKNECISFRNFIEIIHQN